MSVSLNSYAGAIAAYQNAAKAPIAEPSSPPEASPGSFAELVKNTANSALDTMETGEKMSMAALQGKADISQVVTAVAEAEVTLQTVTAVRDKVMEAYNDIIRMPI